MRTRALVVSVESIREFDARILCYSQAHGRFSAVAKSMRKASSRQAMHLDVLNEVEFEVVSGRGLPIITGARTVRSYPALRESPVRFAAGMFLAEVVRTMIFDAEPDELLWHVLTDGVARIAEASDDRAALRALRASQVQLLHALGYAPNLSECALCGTDDLSGAAAFSIHLASTICQACSRIHPVASLEKGDREFLGGSAESGPLAERPGSGILESLFEYIAQRRFIALDMLYGARSAVQFGGQMRYTEQRFASSHA